MSYILDALKKMEHEKVKKNRSGGMASISGELFREERSRPPKSSTGRIIAVAVVASCVAVAATSFFLKPAKAPINAVQLSVPPAAPAPRVSKPATPALQSPVPPPPAVPAQQPGPPQLPVARVEKIPVPQPQAVKQPAPAASVSDAQSTPRTGDNNRQERKKQAVPSEQKPAVATIAPPADIKVSGIAWQEDRRSRRAVVNGFLMKEGSMVAGARITEILQDRVRFSMPGGEFELSMVASGIPGASK